MNNVDKLAAKQDPAISSLHLEPNPFEQSFATTKKPQEKESDLKNNIPNTLMASSSLSPALNLPTAGMFSPGSNSMTPFINTNMNETANNNTTKNMNTSNGTTQISHIANNANTINKNTATVNANHGNNAENVRPVLMNKLSSISISDLTTQLNDDKTNKPNIFTENKDKPPNNFSENKDKPPNIFNSGSFAQQFLFSQQQRPNIMSPGALTPGGTKKLPPLLSPNFMVSNSTGTNHLINGTSNFDGLNTNTNGFLSYLPRSGLTPNESNIRTGLTPGGIFPLMPTYLMNGNSNTNTNNNINNNNNNSSNNNPNSNNNSNNSNNNIHGSIHSNTSNSNNGNISNHNTSKSSRASLDPMVPFTPVINGISNLPHADTNNINVTNTVTSIGTNNDSTNLNNVPNNNTRVTGGNNINNSTTNSNQRNMVSPIMVSLESPKSNHNRLSSSNISGNIINSNPTTNTTNSSGSGDSSISNKSNKNETVPVPVPVNKNKRKLSDTFTTSNNNNNISFTSTIDMKPIRKYKRKSNSSGTGTGGKTKKIDNNNKNDNTVLLEDEDERKRKEFLERNRVAASKFRKRKKEYIQKIENYIQVYEREYNELSDVMSQICGFQETNTPIENNGNNDRQHVESTSLLYQLEDSIQKNNLTGAMTVLNHLKGILSSTSYYQRNGAAPIDPEPVQFNNENNNTMDQNAK